MISGRQHHLLAPGQDHGLQHVHHLRDVRHVHAIGVTMEDVEIDRSHDRIAQRVLLIEEAWFAPRLGIVPRAPFVDRKADLLLGIVLVHHRGILRDQVVHAQRALECRNPLVLGEARGWTLVIPASAWDGVVVK